MPTYKRPIICKDTNESCDSYTDYLKSKHWHLVKQRFRASKLNKKKCYICNTTGILDLHHKSYKRIGDEKLSDFVQLCRKCHKITHYILNSEHGRKFNLWTATKIVRKRSKGTKSPYSIDNKINKKKYSNF